VLCVFLNISSRPTYWHCSAVCKTATRCNTLLHTATHCNTLLHTATLCYTLPHIATYCNTIQHTATRCNTLQHAATQCSTLQHTLNPKHPHKNPSEYQHTSDTNTHQTLTSKYQLTTQIRHPRQHTSNTSTPQTTPYNMVWCLGFMGLIKHQHNSEKFPPPPPLLHPSKL